MSFNGDLADPEIAGHLLVHFAGCDVQHHFLFARRKSLKTLSQLRDVILDDSPLSVALDGRHDGIEQVLVVKRLWKKIHGAMLRRMHGHRNVPVPGHHRHRHAAPRLGQSFPKFEAVHIRKSDIEDNAAKPLREFCAEEISRRGINLGLKRDQVEESLKRPRS
jgi:hypothetical protein